MFSANNKPALQQTIKNNFMHNFLQVSASMRAREPGTGSQSGIKL